MNRVSLTVNSVHEAEFTVNLIPHTIDTTALQVLAEDDKVNVEVGMLARYAERMLFVRT